MSVRARAIATDRPAISAGHVVKRWGDNTVLSDVTVDIGSGITGLLGSNGAGKTTFIGMLLGLHRPSSGTVSVLGLDPTTAGPEIRARVGYSPEHHDLPSDVRAQDLVRHIAEVHGLPRRDARARASDALWLVGLGEERNRPVGTMSTGQRQRVKLAQAIAHDPALVLLDEPTDGLDPVQRDEMLHLIRRVGTEYGIDILLSSHLLEEVERICDSAVILNGGLVAASGPLDELRGDGRGITVELDDQVEEVVADLRARGIDVLVRGRRLDIGAHDLLATEEDLLDALRDSVADHGAALHRLETRRVSLEDVFLEVGT